MGVCGLNRMCQVRGYAVRVFCELSEEPHDWHFDSTFLVEWRESRGKDKLPQLVVRTCESISNQPLVA